MTVDEMPLVTFFKRLLDPVIILGLLYVLIVASNETFTGSYLVLMIIVFFISSYVYEQIELYRAAHHGRWLSNVVDVFIGWVLIVLILLQIGEATGLNDEYNERIMLAWLVLAPCALLVSRLTAYRLASNLSKKGEVRSAVIVGSNRQGIDLAQRIASHSVSYIDLCGFFDDREEERCDSGGVAGQHLGPLAAVAPYVRSHNIKMIFISMPMAAHPRVLGLLDELQDTTASVYFVPDIYTFELMQARLDHIGGIPVVGICETPFTGFRSVIKRGSDIVLALFIQILLLPVMLVIAIGVKLSSPGPIIFKQRRYGLNGEEIIVYKFRSMAVMEDGTAVKQAQRNDPRVTKLGKFLRRSSLDELPQFFNVLQGRMSIVGPRPHAVAHNEMYRKLIKGYMLRHKVKPGITGWAQVNGLRGETDTLEKMQARIEYDLDYLRNWSLALDLWIVFRTIKEVVKKDTAY